jgi:hypothetical protein
MRPPLLVRQGDKIVVPEGSHLRSRQTLMPAVPQTTTPKRTLPAVVVAYPARTAAVLPALRGRVLELRVALCDRVSRTGSARPRQAR